MTSGTLTWGKPREGSAFISSSVLLSDFTQPLAEEAALPSRPRSSRCVHCSCRPLSTTGSDSRTHPSQARPSSVQRRTLLGVGGWLAAPPLHLLRHRMLGERAGGGEAAVETRLGAQKGGGGPVWDAPIRSGACGQNEARLSGGQPADPLSTFSFTKPVGGVPFTAPPRGPTGAGRVKDQVLWWPACVSGREAASTPGRERKPKPWAPPPLGAAGVQPSPLSPSSQKSYRRLPGTDHAPDTVLSALHVVTPPNKPTNWAPAPRPPARKPGQEVVTGLGSPGWEAAEGVLNGSGADGAGAGSAWRGGWQFTERTWASARGEAALSPRLCVCLRRTRLWSFLC